LRRRHVPPAAVGVLRGGDGALHVFRAGVGEVADQVVAVRRGAGLEGRTGAGGGPLSAHVVALGGGRRSSPPPPGPCNGLRHASLRARPRAPPPCPCARPSPCRRPATCRCCP